MPAGFSGGRRRPLVLILGLSLIPLLAAGCAASASPVGVATLASAATGDSAAASGSPSARSENPQQAALDFVACMRSHGVNVPDPGAPAGAGGPTPDPNSPAFQAAMTACQQFLNQVRQAKRANQSATLTAAQQDAYLRASQCMRDHGVNIPDPQFPPSGGIEYPGGVSLRHFVDLNSPAFLAGPGGVPADPHERRRGGRHRAAQCRGRRPGVAMTQAMMGFRPGGRSDGGGGSGTLHRSF
jgi:hypothetical protein